jgi:hypothetical protein
MSCDTRYDFREIHLRSERLIEHVLVAWDYTV